MYGKLAGQLKFPSVKGVPPGMLEFIRRSMSVAPEGRPQSADQVIKGLRRLEAEVEALNWAYVAPPPSTQWTEKTQAYETVALKSTAVNSLLVLLAVGTVILATLVWLIWGVRYQVVGILVGILLAAGGF